MATETLANTPTRTTTTDAPAPTLEENGKLLLRLTVGCLLLFHGLAKVSSGVGPIMDMLAQHGLPPLLAYLAYVGEVVAPVLLILGLWSRAAALLIVINMLFAVGLAHGGDLMRIERTGGWALELQAFYLLGALSCALLGAGRLSLGGVAGRWN